MVDVEKIWANGVAAVNECDGENAACVWRPHVCGEDACKRVETLSVCGAELSFLYCQHQGLLCLPPAGVLLCACWVCTRLCAACLVLCLWLVFLAGYVYVILLVGGYTSRYVWLVWV